MRTFSKWQRLTSLLTTLVFFFAITSPMSCGSEEGRSTYTPDDVESVSVEGQVLYEGTSITDARVAIMDVASKEILYETVTDTKGNFTFQINFPGEYVILAGYEGADGDLIATKKVAASSDKINTARIEIILEHPKKIEDLFPLDQQMNEDSSYLAASVDCDCWKMWWKFSWVCCYYWYGAECFAIWGNCDGW